MKFETYRSRINKITHCVPANRANKQKPSTLSLPPSFRFCILPFVLLSLFFSLSFVAFSTVFTIFFQGFRNLRGISIFRDAPRFHPSSGWKFLKIWLFNYSAIYLFKGFFFLLTSNLITLHILKEYFHSLFFLSSVMIILQIL